MILSAIAARLKRRAKNDFKGRHFEATLIIQAVSWYLRDPLSDRDIEEMLLECGVEIDHRALNCRSRFGGCVLRAGWGSATAIRSTTEHDAAMPSARCSKAVIGCR
jgi:hypothetical protein